MAAKTSWHRCGTKLRHCHPVYRHSCSNNSNIMVCFDACFLISDSHRESLFYILNNDSDRYFRGSRCISLLNISLSKCTISGDLRWRFKIMHLFQVIPSEIFSRTSEIAKRFFHFFVLKKSSQIC